MDGFYKNLRKRRLPGIPCLKTHFSQIVDLITFFNNFNVLSVSSVKKDVGAVMLDFFIGNVTSSNAKKDFAKFEYWSVTSKVRGPV